MPRRVIIMHLFPRVTGISPEVDSDCRAFYFQQITNGLYVRMALLRMVLLPDPDAASGQPLWRRCENTGYRPDVIGAIRQAAVSALGRSFPHPLRQWRQS